MRKGLILAKDIEFKVWDKDEQRLYDVESMHFPLGSASGKDIVIMTADGEHEWRALADVDIYKVIK